MRLEAVDRSFVDAIIQTLLSLGGRWTLAEDAWRDFTAWSKERGRGTPGPPERILYHEVQDLYEFTIEACSPRGEAEVLRECGRSFARVLIRDRLSEFLGSALARAADVAASLEALYLRLMRQYAPYIFRPSARRRGRELRFVLEFSDDRAVDAYLESRGKVPRECYRRSFLMLAGSVEGCLEYLLTPWSAKQLTTNAESGLLRLRLAAGTQFDYARFVRSFADIAQEVERRHERERAALELESDLMLQSAGMRATWQRARVAAESDELILLRGEPGTGKTHLARRIHEMSRRKQGPFVEVGLTADLGADSLLQSDLFGHVKGAFTSAFENRKGLFSAAEGGTIFLDEIGDASPDLQAKLLRVIERKVFKPLGSNRDVTVDLRIVAATNRDLEARMREGAFRADLYHRLNVIPIELPPLRERAREIPILAGHFLRQLSADLKKPERPLSPDAEALLVRYAWPGNLRELIHVLKHALVFAEGAEIRVQDLPEGLRKAAKSAPRPGADIPIIDAERLGEALEAVDGRPLSPEERRNAPWHVDYAKRIYLRALIRRFKGNLRKIALHWERASVTTLRALIRKLDLVDELESARRGR